MRLCFQKCTPCLIDGTGWVNWQTICTGHSVINALDSENDLHVSGSFYHDSLNFTFSNHFADKVRIGNLLQSKPGVPVLPCSLLLGTQSSGSHHGPMRLRIMVSGLAHLTLTVPLIWNACKSEARLMLCPARDKASPGLDNRRQHVRTCARRHARNFIGASHDNTRYAFGMCICACHHTNLIAATEASWKWTVATAQHVARFVRSYWIAAAAATGRLHWAGSEQTSTKEHLLHGVSPGDRKNKIVVTVEHECCPGEASRSVIRWDVPGHNLLERQGQKYQSELMWRFAPVCKNWNLSNIRRWKVIDHEPWMSWSVHSSVTLTFQIATTLEYDCRIPSE